MDFIVRLKKNNKSNYNFSSYLLIILASCLHNVCLFFIVCLHNICCLFIPFCLLHIIKADTDGVVSAVLFKTGDSIGKNVPLVKFNNWFDIQLYYFKSARTFRWKSFNLSLSVTTFKHFIQSRLFCITIICRILNIEVGSILKDSY